MTSSERARSSSAALIASILLALALVLGVAAAVWFTLPNLIGLSGHSVLTDLDFWCVVGSFSSALAASVVSLRYAFAGQTPSRGALLGSVIGVAGLAILVLLIWAQYVMFYALLLAPAHALALVAVPLSWQRQRRDSQFRRFGLGSTGSE